MKKISLLTALLFIVTSGSAFAWSSGTYDAGNPAGTVTVGSTQTTDLKVSKGISLAYASQATGLGYAIATYHASGTRTYASTSGDAKIWYVNVTNKAVVTAPSGTASGDFTSWTAM